MTLREFCHYTKVFFVQSWRFVGAGDSLADFIKFCRGAPRAYCCFMRDTHQHLKATRESEAL